MRKLFRTWQILVSSSRPLHKLHLPWLYFIVVDCSFLLNSPQLVYIVVTVSNHIKYPIKAAGVYVLTPTMSRHASMKFTGGQTCWNGPARSTQVHLHCGGDNQLTAVSEPNR